MEIRPATEDELGLCFDLYLDANNGLQAERGEPPIAPEDVWWWRGIVSHLRRTDPDGVVLAWDGGEPVAFGAAYRRDDLWFLAMLYVAPGRQGSGVGRSVLEFLMPPEDERRSITMATTVETIAPVSTMLYARYGIVPRAPLYWLRGLSRPEAVPMLRDGVEARPLGPDDRAAIDALDRVLLGYARPADHAMWSEMSSRARAYLREDGRLAGYAYLASDGWLGPVAGADDALVPAIVREILDGFDGAVDEVTITVPGYADVVLPALLRAGMRSRAGAGALYCSNGPLPPPSYLPFGGYLP
jgi:GNAT superfamily N-acetyltransferase